MYKRNWLDGGYLWVSSLWKSGVYYVEREEVCHVF